MPARWLLPKCRHIFTLVAVLCVVPASVAAQSSVTLTGRVSETVTLSVAPTFGGSNVEVVSSGGNIVQITLPVDDASDSVIRVPLLVRSNTSFTISTNFESTGAQLSQVSVTDVRATGSLVSPDVVNTIHLHVAKPLLVITGPRVSVGGTLSSPNNALEITVLIHLKPQSDHGLVHLTFVATAGSLTP